MMSEYKLVPVDAIRRAASILGSQGFEAWDQLASELESMIAVAPAVQGEPVGWQYYQHGEWRNGDESIKGHRKNTEEAGFRVRDVYAAPQPLPCQECGGDGAGGEHEEDCVMAKPTPDVAGLVEALEAISRNELDAQRAQHVASIALAAHRKGDQP